MVLVPSTNRKVSIGPAYEQGLIAQFVIGFIEQSARQTVPFSA
jgi:hypothetical protein